MNTIQKSLCGVFAAGLMFVLSAGAAAPTGTVAAFGGTEQAAKTFLTGGRQLAFPGMKLADLKNCSFTGKFQGANVTTVEQASSKKTYAFTDGWGRIHYLLATVQKEDDVYVKGITLRFTEDAKGVWVEALRAAYCPKCEGTADQVVFAETMPSGGWLFYKLQGALVTSANGAGYGLTELAAVPAR